MKSIIVGIIVGLCAFCGVAQADDCEDPRWAIEAVKSGDVQNIRVAQEKVNYCIVIYAGMVSGFLTMKSLMSLELEKDPSNIAVKRLLEGADELAAGNTRIVGNYIEIQDSLNRAVAAIKKAEKEKEKEIEI